MIHIRRSEYEQLLSQKEELIEIRETVRQLRELLNFEKSLQDIRSVRIRSIIDTAIKNGQDVFFALKSFANVSIKNSALSSYKIFLTVAAIGVAAANVCLSVGCSVQLEKTDVISVDISKMNHPVCVIENVIPLETTNDVLIGRNYKIQITPQYYIVGDQHKIIVFSKRGQSKTIISPLGNGPNEVAYIDFYYAGDTSVMIMDVKNRIMEFDYNSRFLKSHPVNAIYHIFACFNDFYLFDNQTPSTEKGNVLSIADKTGKIIKDTIPVIAEGVNYGRNKFQIFKNYALYLPTMSNIIYKIDESANVFPAYQLDFGKYWQDAKTSNKVIADAKGDAFALWKYLAKYDRIGFLSYFDTQEWLFLNFEKRDKRYNWYYNKESKKQYLIECDGSSVAALDIIGVENNRFIAVLEAADYLNSTVVPKLDNLPEDNNPVFVIFDINTALN